MRRTSAALCFLVDVACCGSPPFACSEHAYGASAVREGGAAPSAGCTLQQPFRSDDEDTFRALVDTRRYPLDDLEGERCQQVIADAQELWAATGSVDLPGFIREDVRDRMASEVANLQTHRRLYATPYNGRHVTVNNRTIADPAHPTRRIFQTDIHAAAGDLIPQGTLLRQVYDSPRIASFFARIIGLPRIFQYDDTFQNINVMYQYDGGQRSWHYDGSDFVVTVLLQQGDEGGEFEFAPYIRGERGADGLYEERFDDVRALFDGVYAGPRHISRVDAGTINIFNGRSTLHRVRCVYGGRRISAVLSYDTQPPCAQNLPSVEANVRNYGERVRASEAWHQISSSRTCACNGRVAEAFETEGPSLWGY